MRRAAQALLALAAALAGCGYSFHGNLPERFKTVAVPVFTNRTAEPAIETFLTEAVVQAFVTNGRLRVVKSADADAVLEGEVVGYEIQALAFDSASAIRQYRLTVTMNLKFRDVKGNALLFEQTGFQERADFRVIGAVSTTISQEASALRTAATVIAKSIVSLAIDRF